MPGEGVTSSSDVTSVTTKMGCSTVCSVATGCAGETVRSMTSFVWTVCSAAVSVISPSSTTVCSRPVSWTGSSSLEDSASE